MNKYLLLNSNAELVSSVNVAKSMANSSYAKYVQKTNGYKLSVTYY